MESIKCSYYYFYNEKANAPMSLECGHIFCRSCINELGVYMITCPFDNQRVNYSNSQINATIIKSISRLCKLHFLPITSTCSSHLEPLCSLCEYSHTKCELCKDSFEILNTDLENEYIETNISVINLQNLIESLQLFEISETLDIQTTRFNKVKYFSEQILAAENAQRKTDLIRNSEEFINRKPIEDVKFIIKSLSNAFGVDSAKMPLNFNEILEKFNLFANNMNNEISKIKKKAHTLIYFNMNQIHSSTNRYITHIAIYSQIYYDFYFFNMLGIGGPINVGKTLEILNIELSIEGALLCKKQNIVLVGKKNKMIHLISIPTIALNRNCELFIQIELQDVDRYIFAEPVIDEVVRMTIYDNVLMFPICLLGFRQTK